IDGKMVTQGEQIVVGDVSTTSTVAYEVLCRRHHMRNVTSRVSNPASDQSLPFNGSDR
ncbi:MAG: thymidine kinase, partial [Candidatus Nanopelagicus sp.]|nr:thymidine kinase [Candidatus Nanopelagicus sp.]